MKNTIQITAAALLALAGSVDAQSVLHDGLTNSPLGGSTLAQNASGALAVSNLGSSGLDGVRIQLGDSNGVRFEPDLKLGAQGRCELKCEVMQDGNATPLPVTIFIAGDGSGDSSIYTPDFSGINSPTYTLRLKSAGQLVYEQGGHTGGTKMQQGGGLSSLPQKVYSLANPFGPWGGMFLMCGDFGGGIVTPPGSGVGIACDFIEIISEPSQLVGVASAALTTAFVPDFTIGLEELRALDQWVTGIDDAKIDAEPGGRLKVSNLGSSGCDGVSIHLGGGNELQGELEEIAAPNHPGGEFTFESRCASGQVETVTATETGGEWLFLPDFSAMGSQTYTLELYDQTQLVHQQSGMTGPGVSTAAFARFYKKVTEHADGTTTTEWCIESSASAAHTVVGGPTVQADMITFRSTDLVIARDADLAAVLLRAGTMNGDVFLNGLGEVEPCVGSSYCVGAPNSAGSGAFLCSAGSASIANNDLVLSCNGLPANKFGLFFYGPNQIQAPFGDGFRCVGGQLNRLPAQVSSALGSVAQALDNTAPPTASGQITSGQQWFFQFWYRDPAANGAGFNLSDGHGLLFTP